MALGQDHMGNTLLFSSLLFVFCVINFPRSVHILQKLCTRLAWVSNKSRLACYWFDGAFIICGLLFITSSLCFEMIPTNTPFDCMIWVSFNTLLYLTSSIMLLFFLRNRLFIFVSSAGTWIQLPRYFHLYPVLILFAGFTYFLSLILFAVLLDTESPSEPFQCDYGINDYFVSLFLPSTVIMSSLYLFDLSTFASILLQCRSMVDNVRNSSVTQQSGSILRLSSALSQRRRTNQMVCRLIKPAVLVTVFNVCTIGIMLVIDVHSWQFAADLNFVLISLCITFMYRNPLSHLKAIVTCNIRPHSILAIASPSRSSSPKIKNALARAQTLSMISSVLPVARAAKSPKKISVEAVLNRSRTTSTIVSPVSPATLRSPCRSSNSSHSPPTSL